MKSKDILQNDYIQNLKNRRNNVISTRKREAFKTLNAQEIISEEIYPSEVENIE